MCKFLSLILLSTIYSSLSAQCLNLTYDFPLYRENGTVVNIEEVHSYNIRYKFYNEDDDWNYLSTSNNYVHVCDLLEKHYVWQISFKDSSNMQSPWSDPIVSKASECQIRSFEELEKIRAFSIVKYLINRHGFNYTVDY